MKQCIFSFFNLKVEHFVDLNLMKQILEIYIHIMYKHKYVYTYTHK